MKLFGQDVVGNVAEDRWKDLAADAMEVAPAPNVGAAFQGLVAEPDGWMWVGEVSVTATPQRWYVLDVRGEVRAIVELEPGVQLIEAGSNYLLGIRTDEDDLQTVVIYDWTRPQAQ